MLADIEDGIDSLTVESNLTILKKNGDYHTMHIDRSSVRFFDKNLIRSVSDP